MCWQKGSLPIKLKTSFIKSLKPRGGQKESFTCSRWEGTEATLCRTTLIFQIQRGRVLPSVILQNDLINTSVLLGNLTERAGKATDSATESQRIVTSHSSERASCLGSMNAAENTYMTQMQKSTQTDGRTDGQKVK